VREIFSSLATVAEGEIFLFVEQPFTKIFSVEI
jgi:hypothetical protein